MSILAPYSPPLPSSQMDAIATEIADNSAKEMADLMKTFEPKPARKSQSRR